MPLWLGDNFLSDQTGDYFSDDSLDLSHSLPNMKEDAMNDAQSMNQLLKLAREIHSQIVDKIPVVWANALNAYETVCNEPKPKTAQEKMEQEARKVSAVRSLSVLRDALTDTEKGFGVSAMEVRKAFDGMVEKRDYGFFGEGFAPNVARIRAAKVAKEKAEKVDILESMDF